jgi:hypothetical protein
MRLPNREEMNIKFARQNCEGRAWAGNDCNKKRSDN